MTTEDQEIKDVKHWEGLSTLISEDDVAQLKVALEEIPEEELDRVLYHLSSEERAFIASILDPEDAADLLEVLNENLAAEIVADLDPEDAADVLENLDSDEAADLLAELSEEEAQDILGRMEPDEAKAARELGTYEEGTAGSLMINEYLSYPSSWSSLEIIEDFKKNAEEYEYYNVQYIYVIDENSDLVGILRLRELLFRKNSELVRNFMNSEPKSVRVGASLEELEDFFDVNFILAAPVISNEGKLLGVVRRADVEEELGDKISEEHLRTQGIVGGDELRSMPILKRSGRRISWLSVNIVLNMISASVIALYQDTLEAAITLAVFLPIISDMSGCSGNQAVAVSMRELSLGLVKPFETYWVWIREVSVGLINGVILGILVSLAAYLWQGDFYLGLVVGLSLCINTVIAVSIGGTVPLILKRFNVDPAIASGPLLTTITDMSGFLLVLSLADKLLIR